jgi:hypothetical protein
MPALPEPEPHSSAAPNLSSGRLSRLQQLTLNVWRLASARVTREVPAADVLASAAIHASLAALRDTTNALDLFRRHDARAEEFALVASLVGQDRTRDAVHDLLDSAFLLRWLELTSDGRGPQELPPLSRRPCGPPPLFP